MSGGYDHDGHGHSDEHSHGHGHEHSHTRQGVRDHSHGPRRPAFEADQHALTLYYRALCGRQCEIVAYDDDADMWQHPDTMSTVRLPARPPAESGRWYQVAMTHRALHHSLGTFQLDLDKPELLFARLRPRADQHSVRLRPRADQYSEQPKPQVERANVPPLESFARLFGRTALAIEVFALMEDMRVDVTAHRLYPGLAPAYREACRIALADRPELTLLPPRSAVAEALVQFTLGAKTVTAPDALRTPLARVVSATRRMADPRATVESAAEAAIRVYGVLVGLPNVGGHRAVRPIAFDELAADIDVSTAGFEIEAFREELRLEGDDVLDVRFTPVRFRDSPGPRYLGAQASGMPLQEAILRMTPDDADETGEAGDPDADGFAEKSLQAERGGVDVTAPQRPESPPEPLPHDHGPDLDSDHEHVEGRMRAAGRDEFVYPEWDNVARRYLHDWCLVRVRPPKAVRSDKARRKAMARYGHLLPSVIAALERVHPAGRDLVTRQPSGDDLDLDACIDALIDLRTGVEPSDRVYASMRERRRDVAVAFAVDLSSSTAERLPGDRAARKGEVRRILDLQRDAVILLTEALEAVGDAYGVYGFSGGGRADVRISVVKDLDERRSPAMTHRLEGLTPDHTTRMGPAVRHLTARLRRSEAATKLLFMVSDGRPYDVDYGQQYGDDKVLDYAVADTARAMAEARSAGVRPYLITVDPAGGDYLGQMFDPAEYHVIEDAGDLPTSLAQLYVVARAEARTRNASVPAQQ